MALGTDKVRSLYFFPLVNNNSSGGTINNARTIVNIYGGQEGDYSSYILKDYCPLTLGYPAYISVFDKYLYYRNSNQNYILDLETGTVTLLDGDSQYFLGTPNQSLFGKYLVTCTSSAFKVYKDGVLLQTITQNISYSSITISPLGKYIVALYNSYLYVYEGIGNDVVDVPLTEGDYDSWTPIPYASLVLGSSPPAILFSGEKLFYTLDDVWIIYDIVSGSDAVSPATESASSLGVNLKRSVLGKYVILVPIGSEGSRVVYKDGVANSQIFTPNEGDEIWGACISDDGKYIALITHPEGDVPYSITIYKGN